MAIGSSNPDLAKDVKALFNVGVVANLSDDLAFSNNPIADVID